MDFLPGIDMNPNELRRQDSKDSSISSLSSVPYFAKADLRQTLSVPASAFHVRQKTYPYSHGIFLGLKSGLDCHKERKMIKLF